MTRDDSEWVNEMFSERARDITPPAVRHAARVFYVPVSSDTDVSRRCATVLSEAERARSERFLTKELKTHFEQRRAFRRYCGALALGSNLSLSQIVFAETDDGRPYLRDYPELWFSFSACPSGLIGAWSSTHALGVDLEDRPVDREVTDLARMYFTESEARTVRGGGPARLRRFRQLWSLKEAALKSIGVGLPSGLDLFEFGVEGSLRVVDAPAEHGGPQRFRAHLFDPVDGCHVDGSAALVLRSL